MEAMQTHGATLMNLEGQRGVPARSPIFEFLCTKCVFFNVGIVQKKKALKKPHVLDKYKTDFFFEGAVQKVKMLEKCNGKSGDLRDGESNPGLPRDRRGY